MSWTIPAGSLRSAYKLYAATGAAAPTDALDGVAMEGVSGITTVVEAEAGATLVADGITGQLDQYIYDPMWAAWVIVDPAKASIILPVEANGIRRIAFTSYDIPVRRGRLLWLPKTISLTGGSNLTVYVSCFGKDGVL